MRLDAVPGQSDVAAHSFWVSVFLSGKGSKLLSATVHSFCPSWQMARSKLRFVRMKREDALVALQRLEPSLRSQGLAHLYLFGSVARNDATPKSDVDLAFHIEPTHELRFRSSISRASCGRFQRRFVPRLIWWKAAKARGRLGGRPAKLTAQQLRHASRLLKDPGTTGAEVAQTLGKLMVGRISVSRQERPCRQSRKRDIARMGRRSAFGRGAKGANRPVADTQS